MPRRRVGDAARPLRAAGRTGLNPRLLVGSTDDEVLHSFLGLVRVWRGTKPGLVLPLRCADVAVLVSILGTDAVEIERRLVVATSCDATTARRSRRLLLASVAALSIGLTGTVGAGAQTQASAARSDAHEATVPALATSPVEAVAIEPDQGEQAQAGPASEGGAAIASSSGRAEAIITVPSLGIELPIILGGQSVIDQGVVAHYTAPGWEPPVAAGAPGTYWLAAHHATHGGPFEQLPDVAIGAELRVTTISETYVYLVTSKETVGLFPGDEVVYGSNPAAAVILLQTCLDDTRRVLVHGALVSASSVLR